MDLFTNLAVSCKILKTPLAIYYLLLTRILSDRLNTMDKWTDLIAEQSIKKKGSSLDFTMNAGFHLQSLIHKEDFSIRDSELIFKYLLDHLEYIPFGLYLRRYIYTRLKMKGDFEAISDTVFCEALKNCFIETRTPKSFHNTTSTINVLVNGWLKAPSINRENVFLLGFAMNMPVEDVSMFLTRAICDYDFNFNNPNEVIYWHCYRNNLSARHAMKMIDEYNADQGVPGNDEASMMPFEGGDAYYTLPDLTSWNGDQTITAAQRNMIGDTDQAIMNYLQFLRLRNRNYKYSLTAYKEFCALLNDAKDKIKSERIKELEIESDFILPEKKRTTVVIREADVEKALYSAVPLVKGNLKNITFSLLGKSFAQHRLTRQRISRLLSGKAAISRFDLITLNFLVLAKNDFENPIQRYKTFVEKTDEILKKCFMSPLNISNLYETFILACLLTEDPIYTFSDIWEMAYEDSHQIS